MFICCGTIQLNRIFHNVELPKYYNLNLGVSEKQRKETNSTTNSTTSSVTPESPDH